MGFKMKMGKLSIDNTPVYQTDTEEGVMGQANKNGTILVDKNLSKEEQEDVVRHEKVHLKQMKDGDLDYDDKYMYWKGKKISRSSIDEGNKKLPWEIEAYKANKL
tara:strand:- start:1237 stop:1551 length:315 start_codon:yes stop_codon:yes gene_type:complete